MQKTITSKSEVSGSSINGKYQSKVTFEPAEPNTGIVFIRDDLPGKPEIECIPDYASVHSRWTSLIKNGVNVEHTEHILAAIAGEGITNIRIHLNGPHIPVVTDFSSWGFTQALLEAVPISQPEPKKYIVVKEPHWVLRHFEFEGKRYDSLLLALPAQQFSATYLLDYPGKQVATQIAHFSSIHDEVFISEIAKARSFIMDYEYHNVVHLLGESIKNCLTFPNGNTKLRWSNELARHKLLDLIGDLMIMGQPIKGSFIGFRTGHKSNIELCRILKERA